MSSRIRALVLLASIALALMVVCATLPAMPTLERLNGKNSVTVAPSIRIALSAPPKAANPKVADSAPEPAAKKMPEQATLEPEPEPEPEKVKPKLAPKPEPKPAPPKKEPVKTSPQPEPKSALEPEPEPKPKTVPKAENRTVVSSVPDPPPSPQPVVLNAGQTENVDHYLSRLLRHLMQFQDYPRRAKRLGWEGVPVVTFRFDRQGQLLSYRLATPSDHQVLDEAAMAMLTNAEPLPPVSDSMIGESFSFELPVRFRLQ